MTKQQFKQAYEAPTTESLELRFEGIICESPVYGVSGGAGSNSAFNDYGSDF